jgi:hypothetical protein
MSIVIALIIVLVVGVLVVKFYPKPIPTPPPTPTGCTSYSLEGGQSGTTFSYVACNGKPTTTFVGPNEEILFCVDNSAPVTVVSGNGSSFDYDSCVPTTTPEPVKEPVVEVIPEVVPVQPVVEAPKMVAKPKPVATKKPQPKKKPAKKPNA